MYFASINDGICGSWAIGDTQEDAIKRAVKIARSDWKLPRDFHYVVNTWDIGTCWHWSLDCYHLYISEDGDHYRNAGTPTVTRGTIKQIAA